MQQRDTTDKLISDGARVETSVQAKDIFGAYILATVTVKLISNNRNMQSININRSKLLPTASCSAQDSLNILGCLPYYTQYGSSLTTSKQIPLVGAPFLST